MPEKGARRHVQGQVDINTASERELAKVSDIGAVRARKIVEYRNQHGPFKDLDELDKVQGFGKTLTDDEKSELTVGGSHGGAKRGEPEE